MAWKLNITPLNIHQHIVLPIPQDISHELPSRGPVMIQGTLNGVWLVALLEPDGKKGHILLLEPPLAKAADVTVGKRVSLDIELTQDWPEPEIPSDILSALEEADVIDVWQTLTVKARGEWLRWIRSTKVEATRQKRIGVAISKLGQGDRRPCCFNSAACTIPEIAKSGVVEL